MGRSCRALLHVILIAQERWRERGTGERGVRGREGLGGERGREGLGGERGREGLGGERGMG